MGGIKYCIRKVLGKYNPLDIKKTFFNGVWYSRQHPGECNALTAFNHYSTIGWKKGYEPCKNFATWRLDAISDLYRLNADRLPNEHVDWYANIFYGRMPHTDYDADYKRITDIARGTSNKMLLVSHELSNTGAPRALLYLARHIKESGKNPIVLSLMGGPLRKDFEDAGIPCVVPKNIIRDIVTEKQALFDFIRRFDVVLLNTLDCLPYASAMRDVKVRKFAWIHEGWMSYQARRYYSLNIDHLYRDLEAVMFVSQYSREQAESCFKADIPTSLFAYGLPDEGGIFTTTPGDRIKMLIGGSVDMRKGHHLLLKALSSLPAGYQDQLELHIVGKQAEEDELTKEAFRTCTFKNICNYGPRPHEDVIETIKGMDIVVAPSLDDPLPIICTEAMMCSKPVLTSTNTGTAKVIQEGREGFVFETSDEESLCKALRAVVDSKDSLPQMGLAARKVYEENFSLECFKRNWDVHYAPLIEGGER